MSRLTNDIVHFLETNGFVCSLQMRHDMEVIGVRTAVSNDEKIILPLEISASTIDEAAGKANDISECLRLIMVLEAYPLVITEDRWMRQNEMMKARLLAHLEVFDRIYARNCEVRKIDRQTAADFLTATHSYGDASCRHRYGLFLKRHTGHVAAGGIETVKYPKDTLVAVATFSNARKWTKGDKTIRSHEWTRYASLPGVRLSGGMGKLLKAFIEDMHPDDIMTYADLEWSEGKVYERLGFVLEGVKAPVTFSVDTVSWDRYALKEQDMTSVAPRPYGCSLQRSTGPFAKLLTTPSRGWHVNSGHCPALQPIMTNESAYFRNFGSNKYRLKLTDYQ